MSVSARRHPVVERRDGHTQGRNADEGFPPKKTARPGAPPLYAPVDQWKHGKAGRNSSQAAPAHFSLDLYVCIEKEKALQQRQTGLIQLKLEEDVPHREGGKEHGWSAWSAPTSPAEALVRVAPLRVPVAPLDSSRMASHTHARQVLVRRASRRSWSNVGGRGRLLAFSPRRTVVRERRILRRPAGCVQASHGLPPPYRTAGSVTSQMLAL